MEAERFGKVINCRFPRITILNRNYFFIFYLLAVDYNVLIFYFAVPLPGKFTLHYFREKLARARDER